MRDINLVADWRTWRFMGGAWNSESDSRYRLQRLKRFENFPYVAAAEEGDFWPHLRPPSLSRQEFEYMSWRYYAGGKDILRVPRRGPYVE